MKIEANLNNVKEVEKLPSGTYSVVILTEPKPVTSSQKKTPGIEFTFTFTDPGTEVAPGVPRTMEDTIYKSEKTGWEHFRIKEICQACGVAMENPDTADFINKSLKLAISQETFKDRKGEDRVKNVIDYFLKG